MLFVFSSASEILSEDSSASEWTMRNSSLSLYVAVSCCLSAKQMATSKQCKEPTKEDQRLDHITKLETSLSRQLRFH
jgi:hypothetical protein